MTRRLPPAAALLLAAVALSGSGCRRRPEPAKPAAPPPAPGALDSPEARQAREERAGAVAEHTPQPGVARERCPVLLDPDFGAPQAGTLEEGAEIEVLLAEPGFYGIRTKEGFAFVPARCVRLLPGPLETPSSSSRPRREILPQIISLSPETVTPAGPGAVAPEGAAAASAASGSKGLPPAVRTPLASLPAGAEPPIVLSRVKPVYPEGAKRSRLTGQVVLRAVVEADGRIGAVEVVAGGPAGMTEAAVEAVKSWTYRPARVEGQPVAVWKEIRVRFTLP